jgi:hypothetical protein
VVTTKVLVPYNYARAHRRSLVTSDDLPPGRAEEDGDQLHWNGTIGNVRMLQCHVSDVRTSGSQSGFSEFGSLATASVLL